MRCYATLICVLAVAPAATADDRMEFFESRIRPVLTTHCYECHNSSDTAEGDLVLDFRGGVLKGGAGGPIVVPGKPESSRLIAILKHEIPGLEMPSDGPQLSAAVIADVTQWIRDGAADPRDAPPTAAELAAATSWETRFRERKEWWSLQPIQAPQPPTAPDHGWSRHPVDQFILRRLRDNGLSPAAPAAPHELIRRTHLALTGLPPTVEQLARWEAEFAAKDVATVVAELADELLDSEHYGERWARHWMDWIRYAESHGSEGDPAIDNAWMYRDYLIRALNQDVPVDQLIREHVAGDLLNSPRINSDLGINESAIGTAHWRMVFHGFAPTDALDERVRFTDDQINTFSKAFLGLTVSCARCHDHKFDAISQADYYALFGVLNSCRPARSVIDVSADRESARERMAQLKREIRGSLATTWEKQLSDAMATTKQDGVSDTESDAGRPAPADRASNDAGVPHLSDWYHHGVGVSQGVSAPGEFVIALNGDDIVDRVLPGGVHSNLLSAKDPARLTSPDLLVTDERDLLLLAQGDGDATVRYVVQNYPRNGTVYPVRQLKPQWEWIRFPLSYWAGDTIHIELTAGKDAPLLVKNTPRSWFGIRSAMIVPAGSPPPQIPEAADQLTFRRDADLQGLAQLSPQSMQAVAAAVDAWATGQMSDPQAFLLQHCITSGLLENRIAQIPDVRRQVSEYRQLEEGLSSPTRVPGIEESVGVDQPLFVRGDHRNPSDPVPRTILVCNRCHPVRDGVEWSQATG
jgi:mono/diheme cytochrome c family protein